MQLRHVFTSKEETLVVLAKNIYTPNLSVLDLPRSSRRCYKLILDLQDTKTLTLRILLSGLLDHVTILIGIAVNGKAVGGVINQPFFNYQHKNKVILRCC